MSQHGFPIGGHGAGGIDPNDLTMSGNYQQQPFQTNYMGNNSGQNVFSGGGAVFNDDELLEGLSPPEPQQGMQGQEFGGMNDMGMSYQPVYGSSHHGLPMEQNFGHGFSSTPDGDPVASPWVSNFGQYQQMRHPQTFGGSLQTPLSFAGSPLGNGDLSNDGNKARQRVQVAMQRKPSNSRSPLPPKAGGMAGLSINSESNFGAQPIRTTSAHHEKTHSGQWAQTPTSLSSFPGSFPSPIQSNPLHNAANIGDLLLKTGTSMPAKLGTTAPALSSQDAKKKRRRESHNLVERRRRDNINERIQDLSKLVPAHRLEDEKIRKAIQNGTPLSPTLAGIPDQATSSLAGPGARRAAGGTAGNITTGLPIEEKDKGPNKGDILNGAVSWTRDLMWMLHLKLQQQEELINALQEMGGKIPFEFTDDERRMQTELMDAMSKIEEANSRPFSYSRFAGSGLRVPSHTDYKGEPLNGHSNGHRQSENTPFSPGQAADMLDNEYVEYDDDEFKEEDEYGMDMT